MATFETLLLQLGKTATGIVISTEVIERFGKGKKPAVTVSINGHIYRSTVAVMGGKYMLPVSAENRKEAGVEAGETIQVTLALDTEPRKVSVPDDLQAALDANRLVAERFGKLSYSRQSQYVLSVAGAKTSETRQKRIQKAIESLSEA